MQDNRRAGQGGRTSGARDLRGRSLSSVQKCSVLGSPLLLLISDESHSFHADYQDSSHQGQIMTKNFDNRDEPDKHLCSKVLFANLYPL